MPRTLTELAVHLNRRRPQGLPPLVLMTDPRQDDPIAAAARLPAGSWVVLRHYDDPQREALGRALAKLARSKRLTLLVAGDPRLAARLGAGLHLPEYQLTAACPLPTLHGPLTAACHSRRALARAQALGVNAAIVSPVFPTESHPGAANLGPLRFAALAKAAHLPVYALGGVRPATVRMLRYCTGVATVGGI